MTWIDCKIRKPTAEDGDPVGRVVVRTKTGGLDIVIRHAMQPYHVAWMPIPEFVPLPDLPDGYKILQDYDAAPDIRAMFCSETKQWKLRSGRFTEAPYRSDYIYAIPIKPPEPQYRPFANAEEFKPYRDRWWRVKSSKYVNPPAAYGENDVALRTWQQAFDQLEFECGHPFGVRIEDAE